MGNTKISNPRKNTFMGLSICFYRMEGLGRVTKLRKRGHGRSKAAQKFLIAALGKTSLAI